MIGYWRTCLDDIINIFSFQTPFSLPFTSARSLEKQ